MVLATPAHLYDTSDESVIIYSPNTKRELMQVLPKAYYYKMRLAHAEMYGGSKTPTYDGFCQNFLDELHYVNAEKPSPFKKTRPYVLSVTKGRATYLFPIVIARDEMVKDRDVCTPYILFSEYGSCHVNMWKPYIKDFYDTVGGFRFIKGSTYNPVVLVEDCNPSRYRRYYKHVSSVSMTHSEDTLNQWLRELTPKAAEYWKSVGVTPSMSDNLEMYDGVNVNIMGIRLLQSDGAEGVGVFTYVEGSRELYWDFSRRSIGKYIGNNILYAAAIACKSQIFAGVQHLNLGVGYYSWKENWSKGVRVPVDGIAFESRELQEFMNSEYSKVPESVGHNPDRDRSEA